MSIDNRFLPFGYNRCCKKKMLENKSDYSFFSKYFYHIFDIAQKHLFDHQYDLFQDEWQVELEIEYDRWIMLLNIQDLFDL